MSVSLTQPSSFREEYEWIASYLRDRPLFINEAETWGHTVPIVWKSAVAITVVAVVIYGVILVVVDHEKSPPTAPSSTQKPGQDATTIRTTSTSPSRQTFKTVYQATNLLVNIVLAVVGFNLEAQLPRVSDVSFETLTMGFNHTTVLPAIQVGYQLWAIPFGLLLVNESPIMLGHHFSVVLVAAGPMLLTVSFKYYAPFFFGVIEASSIPLAIMNAFRNNQDWIDRYPTTYGLVRQMFAYSFLWFRWIRYVPHTFHYGRLLLFSAIAAEPLWLKIYLSLSCVGTGALLLMQTYWGMLICRGLLNLFIGKKDKPKKK